MHEATLAANILDTALRIARERNAAGIASVHLRIGALQAVVPEALETAFNAGKAGTPADRATLQWELVPARVRCPDCGGEYAPDDLFWICPECDTPGGVALEGNELDIISMELIEGPEGSPS
jgi:hydrogenase nickel incorporation protein HypA/HybF